jgi:hypothetical protein
MRQIDFSVDCDAVNQAGPRGQQCEAARNRGKVQQSRNGLHGISLQVVRA